MKAKSSRNITPLVLSLAAAGSLVSAQAVEPVYKNRFGVSYKSTFLVSASFKNIGAAPAASNPGIAATEQNHTYDDGYVLPDSAAGDGMTWNWGYQNASQVPGNDTIQFHSAQSTGGGQLNDIRSDPQHGVEVTYERWAGRMGDSANWGWRLALGYMNVGIKSDRSVSATSVTTTDTYGLGGVIPPQPPYMGTFNGPGPLINDTPSRSFSSATSVVTGHHEVDADVFGLHVGPYFEFPINDRLSFNLSSGLALGMVKSEFRFSESAGGGSVSGSSSKMDAVFGGYVGANVVYALSERWNLVVGAEYEGLTDFKQRSQGRIAKIEFLTGVSAKAGLSFSF